MNESKLAQRLEHKYPILQAPIKSMSGLGIPGVFIGLRVRQYTRIIRHDLGKIGTSVRGIGWLECVFIFIITAVVFAFGLLSFFEIL
jgi:hypothetical protein